MKRMAGNFQIWRSEREVFEKVRSNAMPCRTGRVWLDKEPWSMVSGTGVLRVH